MNRSQHSLEESNVLVIGGSAGIGLAAARAFLCANAYVTITGRSQARLDKAVHQLGHERASAIQADGTSQTDTDRLFNQLSTINHLVVAFGSSGVSKIFQEMNMTTWRSHFEEKFFGHLLVLQTALPKMHPAGSVTM